MSQLTYEKKIIATFDSYEHLAQHLDFHENYHDFMVEQADALGIVSVDYLPWKTTWWCGTTQLDTMFQDYPPWTPEIDGKPIRAELLVSSQLLSSLLDKIAATTQQVGQGPDHIEVVDNV
jgi:hypothetical protein